ncbi:MAG: hypothetical protein LBB25_04090 [Holosporaceae bacterium]|nr:hypothetical protein [Holosporaceae bacterium]
MLKKVIETAEKIKGIGGECYSKLVKKISFIPVSYYVTHIKSIVVLILIYGLASFLVYPKFDFYTFLKEIFSLLCAYGAILLWFVDKLDDEDQFKIAMGTTACIAPILFINNPWTIALSSLLLMIFGEFIFFRTETSAILLTEGIDILKKAFYSWSVNLNLSQWNKKFSAFVIVVQIWWRDFSRRHNISRHSIKKFVKLLQKNIVEQIKQRLKKKT